MEFLSSNVEAAHQRDLGKVRQAREIKSTQVCGKWQ